MVRIAPLLLFALCPVALQSSPVPPPTTIKVGGFVYQLKWEDKSFLCGGSLSSGCTNPETLTIQIKRGMAAAYERYTLWHEVKHAAANNVRNPYEPDKEIPQEQWIEMSAPTELEIMRDNPKLMEYLLGGQ